MTKPIMITSHMIRCTGVNYPSLFPVKYESLIAELDIPYLVASPDRVVDSFFFVRESSPLFFESVIVIKKLIKKNFAAG